VLATPAALAQMASANPALAAFVPQLRVAFANSVIPLFWVAFAVSIVSVVASLFITGSMKQQIAAGMAMAGQGPPEKKDFPSSPGMNA